MDATVNVSGGLSRIIRELTCNIAEESIRYATSRVYGLGVSMPKDMIAKTVLLDILEKKQEGECCTDVSEEELVKIISRLK